MSDFEGHFADEVWFDLIRGLLAAGEAQQIRAHLDQGCPECRERFEIWNQVWESVGREAGYEAPADAVRHVKAAYDLKQRVPLLSRLAQSAQLVLDSFREPLPAGIRGGVPAQRHLRLRSGNFFIDLRLETEAGGQVGLAGQILHSAGVDGATAGTGIVLVEGQERLVTQTITNWLGEFHLEFDLRSDANLYLAVPGAMPIAVALPGRAEQPRQP